MSTFAGRIVRAAKLDPNLYAEVETDKHAFKQAVWLVIMSSVAGGIGSLVPNSGLTGLLGGILAAFLGWVVWTLLVYWVGVKLLGGPMSYSNAGELLRVTSFASAPGLLRIIGIIPSFSLKTIVFFISLVWMLIAMVVAVRQALDYSSTVQTFLVCLVGWFCQIIVVVGILWFSRLIYLPALPA